MLGNRATPQLSVMPRHSDVVSHFKSLPEFINLVGPFNEQGELTTTVVMGELVEGHFTHETESP